MNFFLYQPEVLYSINIIPGQMVGLVSAVSLFGICFIFLSLAFFIFNRFLRWPIKQTLLWLALVAWEPLLLQFFYSSIMDFKNIYNFIGASEESQIIWRYCNMDKNQQYHRGFCNIYPFIKEVRNNVPKGSTIKMFTSNIANYFRYYLYDSYNLTLDNDKAEYFIFYRSPGKFLYDAGKVYSIDNGLKTYLGKFVVVKMYDNNTAILKRLK